MVEFSNLFTPLHLKGITLRNRIVSTAHAEAYADQGNITDQLIAYQAEKAKGGLGLTIVGAGTSVHPTSPASAYSLICNHDDSVISQYQRLARAIHDHGAAVFTQLTHMGRRSVSDTGDWKPLLAPSGIPEPYHREVPHAMEVEDIQMIVRAFGQAARRCKAGGLDGIEILAGWNHLIDQFWSPRSNQRTDPYGGSLENRMRFGLEVLEEVRGNVGEDYVVGLRMSGDEFLAEGLTQEELIEIARRMTAGGHIDYLNIISGSAKDIRVLYKGFPNMYHEQAPYIHIARAVKDALPDMPVLHAGRVVDPQLAEQVLAKGDIDLVGMTRAIIADPHMPNKAREGRLDDIRTCVGINQDCIDRLYFGKSITCSINPVIGREQEMAQTVPAKRPKKVVVIGGGPGGMECARIAAERGHTVILLEKSDHLGGQVAIAARAPKRNDLLKFIDWEQCQLEKQQVEIRLATEATADTVLALDPEAVVVATGSRPFMPNIEGIQSDHVVTAWDVLQGRSQTGQRVLVIDDDAQQQGLSTAEFLLNQDKHVQLVTRLFYAGEDVGVTTIVPLYERLFSKGIEIIPHSRVTNIEDGTATVENIYSKDPRRLEVETVVIAAGSRAVDDLYHALKGRARELYMAGDCVAPRKLHHAILEGSRVARAL